MSLMQLAQDIKKVILLDIGLKKIRGVLLSCKTFYHLCHKVFSPLTLERYNKEHTYVYIQRAIRFNATWQGLTGLLKFANPDPMTLLLFAVECNTEWLFRSILAGSMTVRSIHNQVLHAMVKHSRSQMLLSVLVQFENVITFTESSPLIVMLQENKMDMLETTLNYIHKQPITDQEGYETMMIAIIKTLCEGCKNLDLVDAIISLKKIQNKKMNDLYVWGVWHQDRHLTEMILDVYDVHDIDAHH